MNLESWDPFQRLADFRRRSSETLDELLAHLSEPDDRKESIAFQPEVDVVVCLEQRNRLIDSGPGTAAVKWHAAEPTQQNPQRKPEQGTFGKEPDVEPDCHLVDHRPDAIPVGRVRRRDDDCPGHIRQT